MWKGRGIVRKEIREQKLEGEEIRGARVREGGD